MARLKGQHWLMVVAYHRIADPDSPTYVGLRSTASAAPEHFRAQMKMLRRSHDVISLDDLHAFIQGRGGLPPRPALITFDDGYRDNHDVALPILRELGLPAVFFLTTDHITSQKPFYWDAVSHCFAASPRSLADVPLLGLTRLDQAPETRGNAPKRWLTLAKSVPEEMRQDALVRLTQALDVNLADPALAEMVMDWDHVRALARAGMAIGAHTRTHAILTRLPLDEALEEAGASKDAIETRIDRPVTTLAYPNGKAEDFSDELAAELQGIGFESAFTLMPGPVHQEEVVHAPLAIRRTLVSHKDRGARFAMKTVFGVPRWLEGGIPFSY